MTMMQPTSFTSRAMPGMMMGASGDAEPRVPGRVVLGRSWNPLPFASLSSSVVSNLGKPSSKPGQRSEPQTGYDYPLEFCYAKKPCPSLLGIGVRSKHILVKNVNVYALGVYVDTGAAKSALGSFKSKPAADLVNDQKLYDAVVNSDFEKSLRLVISSGLVNRKKFVDALEERLAPRLKEAGEPATLDAFRKQFDAVQFHKDLEITFVSTSKGQLDTLVDGKKTGSIKSAPLVKSLFDIYLGADPVSKDTKQSFGQNLVSVLKH